jgi:hypothetical protein
MLRLVEYGLLAVSLLTVIGLILATPRVAPSIPAAKPVENTEPEAGQIGKG